MFYQKSWTFTDIEVGIISMGDVDGDGKFDLVVGNQNGGVVLYSQNIALGMNDNNHSQELFFTLYPMITGII